MKFLNKNILLISPSSWSSNFVSKHHYAIELNKLGNNVYYLNPPSLNNNQREILPNLIIVNYKIKYRGLSILPRVISSFLTRKEINFLENKMDVNFDIIWNFDSSRFFNLSSIKGKLKIAHLLDYSEDFNRELLSKTSNICFGVSEEIVEEMRKSNVNSFRINHGLSVKIDNSYNIKDVNKNHKIKVGYIGNLTSKYLDWEIIFQLVAENTESEFYFLGDDTIENNLSNENKDFKNKTQALSNSFFLGNKQSNLIPKYLDEFDINLICYRDKDYPKQITNSHKILEYLHSGHVIISNYMSDYKNNSDLIEMVQDTNIIPAKFKEVLSNLDYFNSEENMKMRINFSLEHTYSKQLDKIINIINSSNK